MTNQAPLTWFDNNGNYGNFVNKTWQGKYNFSEASNVTRFNLDIEPFTFRSLSQQRN